MKFAIALVAGVAILASVHAAPAVEDDLYISESLKDIITAVRGRIQDKVDELQQRRAELREAIKRATGEVKEQLKQSLEQITAEVQDQMRNLLEVIKRAVRKNEESYFREAVVGKIREYGEKAREILQRVSEIVRREAVVIGQRAKARFEEEKQRLIDEVQRVNEQIKQAVTDVINGKQEETYALDTYFIDAGAIRAKIADLRNKFQELAEQARDAVGAKKEEISKKLELVKIELIGAAKDLRNAFRDMLGKDPITYNLADELDDVYIVETVRNLRKKLNEKLEQVKGYVEMIKVAHGVLKEQLQAGLETARKELKNLKEEILGKVKEELNKPAEE